MRNIFAVVLAGFLIGLSGCALADLMAGIERDEQGKVTNASGGLAEKAFGFVDALFFGGTGVAGAIGGGLVTAYRHKRIVDAGGKDDNFDGKPDPEQTPKA